MTDQSSLRSSIAFFMMKSRKEKWFSNISISTDEQITDILVKPLSKMKSLQARAHGVDFLI
jgi:hypothetical protein